MLGGAEGKCLVDALKARGLGIGGAEIVLQLLLRYIEVTNMCYCCRPSQLKHSI